MSTPLPVRSEVTRTGSKIVRCMADGLSPLGCEAPASTGSLAIDGAVLDWSIAYRWQRGADLVYLGSSAAGERLCHLCGFKAIANPTPWLTDLEARR